MASTYTLASGTFEYTIFIASAGEDAVTLPAGSTATLHNCICISADGTGLVAASASVTVKNCILKGDVADATSSEDITASSRNNCFVSGAVPANFGTTGNVLGDPAWYNETNGDYNIRASSRCAGAGVDLELTTDFYGNTVHAYAPSIGVAEVRRDASIKAVYSPIFLAYINTATPRRIATRFHVDASGNPWLPTLIESPELFEHLPDPFSGIEAPDTVRLRISGRDTGLEDNWWEIADGEELRKLQVKLYLYDEISGATSWLATGKINRFRLGDIHELEISIRRDRGLETILPYNFITTSTFSNTALNLGEPIPIPYGRIRAMPLLNIQEDTTNNYYDYLIGHGGTYGIQGIMSATGRGVHRNGVLVNSSEYTLYDGTQASPFAGYAFIRFVKPQRDFSDRPMQITADVNGMDLDNAGAVTLDFVVALQDLLTNTTYGLGDSADATTFGAVDAIEYLGCPIIKSRQARDIIREWLACMVNYYIYRAEDGEWEIAQLTTGSSAATFGEADGFYNNCKVISLWTTPLENLPKTLSIRAKPQWDDMQRWCGRAKFTVGTIGRNITIDWPSAGTNDFKNAVEYLGRRFQYGDLFIEIETGIEARTRRRGEIITVIAPGKPPLASPGETFIIEKMQRTLALSDGRRVISGYKIQGRLYTSDLYTWVTPELDEESDTDTNMPENANIGPYIAKQFIDNTPFTDIDNTDSPYSASNGERLYVDTSSGAVTITLPASPAPGWRIYYLDRNGAFNTNNFTLARNGKLIEGAASDSVRSTNNEYAEIYYSGATYGWRIMAGVTG